MSEFVRNPYLFQQIREQTDTRRIMEDSGVQFNRFNKACCPFHNEKTASLSVKNNRYKCFGCGASGGAVDFIMNTHGMGTQDAAKYIIERYGLNIDMGGVQLDESKLHEARKREAERKAEQERIQAEKEYDNYAYGRLCKYLHWLREQPETELIKNHIAWVDGLLDRRLESDKLFKREQFDVDNRIKGMYQQHRAAL